MDQSQINQSWADRFFAEPRGPAFSAERDGSDGVAPPSRPSNDPDHASKCERQETADALQPCSSMILQLAKASWQPTALQQSLRRAWGRSILSHRNRVTGPRLWSRLSRVGRQICDGIGNALRRSTSEDAAMEPAGPGRPNGACHPRAHAAAALRATADASRVPSDRPGNRPRITWRITSRKQIRLAC